MIRPFRLKSSYKNCLVHVYTRTGVLVNELCGFGYFENPKSPAEIVEWAKKQPYKANRQIYVAVKTTSSRSMGIFHLQKDLLTWKDGWDD